MIVHKLGDICKMQSGGTPSRKEPLYYKNGTIPWAKIRDIEKSENGFLTQTEEYITKDALASINNRIFPRGTLLFAMYGSVGKVSIADIELSTNQAILGIIPDGSKLDLKYLSFWLKSKVSDFKNQARGVALKNLSATIMKSQEIPLPPLETQKKIAAILDKADALRQNDQQILQKYDQLTQSIFLDMFGDPVTNPKGWEKIPFEKTSKNLDSKRIPIKQSDREQITGKYPYYGATGIVDYINDFIFNGEHLLIAEDGKNLVNRKKPIAWTVLGQFWVNNHSHIVEYNGVMNLEYLGFHLNTMDISNYVTGIDQFKMNKSNLNRIPIMNPPSKLQNQFATIVEQIEKQKQLTQQSLQKSEELFQSLLQRAFKGELL